jgi:hypothetical protein
VIATPGRLAGTSDTTTSSRSPRPLRQPFGRTQQGRTDLMPATKKFSALREQAQQDWTPLGPLRSPHSPLPPTRTRRVPTRRTSPRSRGHTDRTRRTHRQVPICRLTDRVRRNRPLPRRAPLDHHSTRRQHRDLGSIQRPTSPPRRVTTRRQHPRFGARSFGSHSIGESTACWSLSAAHYRHCGRVGPAAR